MHQAATRGSHAAVVSAGPVLVKKRGVPPSNCKPMSRLQIADHVYFEHGDKIYDMSISLQGQST